MAERITDRLITTKVRLMQNEGMNIDIDGQYGRWRVTNSEGSVNLSPRASNREVYDWLHAYSRGWEAGKEFQFNKMRKEVMDYSQDVPPEWLDVAR